MTPLHILLISSRSQSTPGFMVEDAEKLWGALKVGYSKFQGTPIIQI